MDDARYFVGFIGLILLCAIVSSCSQKKKSSSTCTDSQQTAIIKELDMLQDICSNSSFREDDDLSMKPNQIVKNLRRMYKEGDDDLRDFLTLKLLEFVSKDPVFTMSDTFILARFAGGIITKEALQEHPELLMRLADKVNIRSEPNLDSESGIYARCLVIEGLLMATDSDYHGTVSITDFKINWNQWDTFYKWFKDKYSK